jgi:hypothetical protein
MAYCDVSAPEKIDAKEISFDPAPLSKATWRIASNEAALTVALLINAEPVVSFIRLTALLATMVPAVIAPASKLWMFIGPELPAICWPPAMSDKFRLLVLACVWLLLLLLF